MMLLHLQHFRACASFNRIVAHVRFLYRTGDVSCLTCLFLRAVHRLVTFALLVPDRFLPTFCHHPTRCLLSVVDGLSPPIPDCTLPRIADGSPR